MMCGLVTVCYTTVSNSWWPVAGTNVQASSLIPHHIPIFSRTNWRAIAKYIAFDLKLSMLLFVHRSSWSLPDISCFHSFVVMCDSLNRLIFFTITSSTLSSFEPLPNQELASDESQNVCNNISFAISVFVFWLLLSSYDVTFTGFPCNLLCLDLLDVVGISKCTTSVSCDVCCVVTTGTSTELQVSWMVTLLFGAGGRLSGFVK